MAVSDGESITVVKDMGLVTSVFDVRTVASLGGHVGLGHVRYSTAGPSTWQNAQPAFRSVGSAGFALGHNGNLTNVSALEDQSGMLPGIMGSDSELVAELIEKAFPPESALELADDALENALLSVLPRLERVGIFSRGRFGAWKYEVSNQDHSFAQGYEWATRVVRGGTQEDEPTLNDPNRVNARRDN